MRINIDEADFDDDLRYFHQVEPFTGEAIETAPTGELIALTTFRMGSSTDLTVVGTGTVHAAPKRRSPTVRQWAPRGSGIPMVNRGRGRVRRERRNDDASTLERGWFACARAAADAQWSAKPGDALAGSLAS